MRPAVVVLPFLVAVLIAGCGGSRTESEAPSPDAAVVDPGPVHVHGLGRDPADGALYIATHTGLFRRRGTASPVRVAGRYQDTMGFEVVGPGRFLGSGHPDSRDELPPFLGLIESRDAGESWRALSLQGEMDFHGIEASGGRVYGFGTDWESREERLVASSDRARRWRRLSAPEPFFSLALEHGGTARLAGAGEGGVHVSIDGGRSWQTWSGKSGLLAWADDGLIVVGNGGDVSEVRGPDRPARKIGMIGGEPAALDRGDGRELLAALHDGTVKASRDGGRTWKVVSPAPSR